MFNKELPIETLVIDTLAELTRYPKEILILTAALEEDLGIDSLKRAEIAAALSERLGTSLPELSRFQGIQSVKTIGDVVALVAEVQKSSATSPVEQTKVVLSSPPRSGAPLTVPPFDMSFTNPSIPLRPRARPEGSDILAVVVGLLSNITGHANLLFAPDARLDEDLGIDYATLTAAIESIKKQFGLAEWPDAIDKVRTVGDLVTLTTKALEASGLSAHKSTSNGQVAPPKQENPDEFLFSATAATPGKCVFEGKVVLVTGSGRGIGQAIALLLANLGAKVVVNSFYSRAHGDQTVAQIKKAGGEAIHVWGSIANPAHVDKMFDEIQMSMGGLDYYVQNASNGVIGPLQQVTLEHWERAFRTNVIGFHQAAFRAAELMKTRGGGRIVALSSPGAHRYLEHFGCLGPVKAAVESLALYLAVDLGRFNVQVNVLSAGPVYGERLSNYPDADRLIPYWENLSVDGRLGEAREIATNVVYLLSPAARKINGTVVLIDSAASQRI